MREIKFRAWDKRNKLMIQNIFSVTESGSPDLPYALVPPDLIWMQFTGLHDKNGKEIWEGDILIYRGEPVVVEYFGDMFHCRSTKYPNLTPGNYRLMTLKDTCEVLGNVYENSELLKP